MFGFKAVSSLVKASNFFVHKYVSERGVPFVTTRILARPSEQRGLRSSSDIPSEPATALFRGFRGHDNQRAHVVTSLLIPFHVGGIAVRERLRPPAAAVHTFALDICEIETRNRLT